jgi:hypothetical protein
MIVPVVIMAMLMRMAVPLIVMVMAVFMRMIVGMIMRMRARRHAQCRRV